MRRLVSTFVLVVFGCGRLAAEQPHSVDPRVQVTLFAEQPLIATPTGIDVDARGRVWAIECNTHFRPTDYPGHPSDRILVFADKDGDGRAEPPTMFADGFTATMSVAVRPAWMSPITFDSSKDDSTEATGKEALQVFVATRNRVMLLEDLDGDDVSDRQTVLFELETKGNYPHNGFAGFAFDPEGNAFVGMGENLGEPYKIHDRNGKVVFESKDGGNIYRFRPDGSQFELWAYGFWNPHSSCFDAFGQMFTVDNDPDSRPPCRLLHVVEGGDYGYRFSNGRKGLHPFTSWNGQIPGTLPMAAGTGEAPAGVVAYEHDALPAEYLGNLFATSWGDHRIDRFRLHQRGASFESIPEPWIVGDEDFRPVGIALGPDGSLYCTDWVRRDYELHGQGRIWRIAAKSNSPQTLDAAEKPDGELDPSALQDAVKSGNLATRRTAARRLAIENGDALLPIVLDENLPLRARYEALMALAVLPSIPDHVRVLKSYIPVDQAPFDPLQTVMAKYYDERPSVTRVLNLLNDPQGSDPLYLLNGIESFSPIFRALGDRESPAIVKAANQCTAADDPFAESRRVRVMARTLTIEQMTKLIASEADLSPRLRLDLVLAAKQLAPHDESPIRAALLSSEPLVRRAAVQWAGEQRLTGARDAVQASLSRLPMTTDLFLATIAGLEMIDGQNPQEFDKTPASKYVIPLASNPETPPAVLAAALRIADPNDPAITVDLLTRLAESDNTTVQAEAARTLAFSNDPRAVDELMKLAVNPSLRADALLGLSRWLHQTTPPDAKIRSFFFDHDPWTVDTLRAARGLVATDSELQKALLARLPTAAANSDPSELIAQAQLALGDISLPPNLVGQLKPRPHDVATWQQELSNAHTGNADAGRIVFFHPQGPGCSRCHTVEGRGGKVGPDLSQIGRTMSHERLVESILDPGREVAPQFTNWQMVTADGRVHTGMIVHENEGLTVLGDQEGKTDELKTIDIIERRPQRISVMPEKLADRMTVQEFRDLLVFLKSPGN